MIRGMKRLTSFRNLWKVGNPRGQIATLLIMLTVVLLIFVMVTMNIGETSLMSTRIANATDAATLSLASQLSTKARQLAHGLKNSEAKDTSYTKACNPSGAAAIIIAIVCIIVAIVIFVVTCGSGAIASAKLVFLAMCILAGAVGGAIGGAYAGTGAWQGAFQGACIGAAIGSICIALPTTTTATGVSEGVVGAGDTLVFSEGATIGTAEGAMAVPAGATLTGVGGGAAVMSVPMSGGLMLQGALCLASAGYNQHVQEKVAEKQIDLFVEMMANMNEKDRMRESAFMTALSQVVDDPNMSADAVDSNLNTNTSELVSNFQIWVFNRLNYFGTLVGDVITPINGFFDMTRFYQSLFFQLCDGRDTWEEIEGGTFFSHHPGTLETEDYRYHVVCEDILGPFGIVLRTECHEEIIENAGNDGSIAKLARGLENAGYDLSFWEPGPTLAALQASAESCGEDSCEGPAGFDPVDGLREELREVREWLIELDKTDKNDRAETWGGWLDFFVDLGDSRVAPESIYFTLEKYIAEMKKWRAETLAVVKTLPECVQDPNDEDAVLSFPCRYGENSCTVTKKRVDAFDQFYGDVLELEWTLGDVNGLNSLIRNLYNSIYSAPVGNGLNVADLGGMNPAQYEWNDTRGHHIVKVGTGNFKVPHLKKTKYGNWFKGKKCMELRDYSDNGSRCWVKVERIDEKHDLGVLGFWNPFAKGITKIARAAYSYDYLKLVKTAE
ncbi:MAG: Tad domain-containing protein [Candidatus Omnitrophota bacterium]